MKNGTRREGMGGARGAGVGAEGLGESSKCEQVRQARGVKQHKVGRQQAQRAGHPPGKTRRIGESAGRQGGGGGGDQRRDDADRTRGKSRLVGPGFKFVHFLYAAWSNT